MTKPISNATNVTATLSCERKDFRCTIQTEGGSELYFSGMHGIEVFLNMLDMFYIDEEDNDYVH